MSSAAPPIPALRLAKLLDRLCERIQPMRYSMRTEEIDVSGYRAIVRLHGLRHPMEMGKQRWRHS